ncbi:hypothetical protein K458DRAFT_423551 [Lentithecium fluviatile CBS 122367]|uniref:Uncharacterized protein n=1 Tax=Lentithecium fluviatile CBS 122367 TaxID=1168545 RepID=A0A6G1II83_9PLEO|nr:hypothetical protein K458DRAFT_423551 [Lentithecium fluviatile CBS 122367]
MKDPKHCDIKSSCFVKGFEEIAKLRDHLKSVHRICEELQQKLNFRQEPFRNLKDKDEKWKLAFQILFPEVPKDHVPPSRLGDPAPFAFAHERDAKHNLKLNELGHLFENQIWARFGKEKAVHVVDFIHSVSPIFRDVAKMWLELNEAVSLGTSTTLRSLQISLDEKPAAIDYSLDLPTPDTSFDYHSGSTEMMAPSSPNGASTHQLHTLKVEDSNCDDMLSPEPIETHGLPDSTSFSTTPLTLPGSSVLTESAPNNGLRQDCAHTLLESANSPVSLKVEEQESTLVDYHIPSGPCDPSANLYDEFDPTEWQDLFNFSAFSSFQYPHHMPDHVDENDGWWRRRSIGNSDTGIVGLN